MVFLVKVIQAYKTDQRIPRPCVEELAQRGSWMRSLPFPGRSSGFPSSHAISSPPIAAPGRFRFFRFLRKSCAFEEGDNPRVGRPWVRQGQIERFVGYVESQSSSVGVIARRAPLLFPKRDL